MSAFAQWVGYVVIVLSTLAGVAFIAGWVMDYVWRKINDARSLATLRQALRAYDSAAREG